MEDGFIFWRQPLRVSGPCDARAASGKILSLITTGGIGVNERLVGTLNGEELRVWRSAPFAQAGDVVEFRGVLRAEGDGSVIEGSVSYKLRTRFQFVGFLVLGLLLAAAGLVGWLQAAAYGFKLAGIGVVITLGTLAWIGSSRMLAWKQIAFIEERLAQVLRV